MTDLKFMNICMDERGEWGSRFHVPVIRTSTPSGRLRDIDLTEDGLHKVITDAVAALRFIKARRADTREGPDE